MLSRTANRYRLAKYGPRPCFGYTVPMICSAHLNTRGGISAKGISDRNPCGINRPSAEASPLCHDQLPAVRIVRCQRGQSWRSLVLHGPGPLWRVDSHGELRLVNATIGAACGLSRTQLRGIDAIMPACCDALAIHSFVGETGASCVGISATCGNAAPSSSLAILEYACDQPVVTHARAVLPSLLFVREACLQRPGRRRKDCVWPHVKHRRVRK